MLPLLLLAACSEGFDDARTGPNPTGDSDSGLDTSPLTDTSTPTDTRDTSLPDTTPPRGVLDHVGCDGLWGWALDDDALDRALLVRATFDDGTTAEATADPPRPDVCGEPCNHGFDVDVPEALTGDHAVTVEALDPATGAPALVGSGSVSCGGDTPSQVLTDLYREGDSYVAYQPIAGIFEKTDGTTRDRDRQLMPLSLPSWSIANFDRDLLIYSDLRLTDGSGRTLFRAYDTEGAVHVSLAQTERETTRGNNHQGAYSDFLIAPGTYTVTFTNLATSAGRPSLMFWQQRDGNRFVLLVGGSVTGAEESSVDGEDGVLVEVGETVSQTFSIGWLDEDNALYKGNANGFERADR
jgi:hypothetical protein